MRIGITQRVLMHKGRGHDSLDQAWYEYLSDHKLVVIPNRLPVSVPDMDMLIITGGDDHPVSKALQTLQSDIKICQPVITQIHITKVLR